MRHLQTRFRSKWHIPELTIPRTDLDEGVTVIKMHRRLFIIAQSNLHAEKHNCGISNASIHCDEPNKTRITV